MAKITKNKRTAPEEAVGGVEQREVLLRSFQTFNLCTNFTVAKIHLNLKNQTEKLN